MKIHLFIDYLGAGGAQRQLVGLAIMLKNKGYDIKVCTYYPMEFYKNVLDDSNVPNELIPGANNTKKRIFAVWSYFKKEKPDWVIAYQETPSLVACATKLLGCKYKLIVSERNTTQFLCIKDKVRFFLYRWADRIVPNCYTQEKWLTDHYSWMLPKTETISNFVDLNRFVPVVKKRHDVPEILIAATIRESKNTIGLLKAISILKSNNIACHFTWYGVSNEFSDYYNQCCSFIDSNNLSSYIKLCEKTKDIENKYKESDFFCLPSFYEGTPNVICEAISSGLPVLASNVCDNAIYVKDDLNGYLFDPYNPEDIANKIRSIISLTEEHYHCACIESRKLAEKLLSGESFINKYLNIIEN